MKILLADDHALFRDGAKLTLKRLNGDNEIIETDSFTGVLDLLDQHRDLDLILLDLTMPGAMPFEGLEKIRTTEPDIPIIVLSASETPEDVKTALDLGANGYVTKSGTNDVLLGAIRLVLAGGTYIPLEVFDKKEDSPDINIAIPNSALPNGFPDFNKGLELNLTRRQMEILRHLIAGKTNREIGDALSISETTVKSHVTTIFRSLGVSNRTQAVLRTIELELFPGGDV